MELFDYYLRYMTELLEGKRPAPEGITLTAEDEEGRTRQITEQLASMGAADFVRACAAQDGEALPESLFDGDSGMAGFEAFLKSAQQTEEPAPQPEPANEPDPDAGKHAFEVFCDCLMLDENLIAYLIDVLKANDRAGFYKLSQVTTHLDLDPDEFLYWLAHREDYAETDEERACAVILDACLDRLRAEGQMEVAAALLSGDRMTFDALRCEAPELRQLPVATYMWFEKNYLDRDYPLRFVLRCNGVQFPDTLKKEP